MKVKLRNNREFTIAPKDAIIEVISENNDSYLGNYYDEKRQRSEVVRVKKENCVLIK